MGCAISRMRCGVVAVAALSLALLCLGCGGGGGTTSGPRTVIHNEDLVPEVQVQVVDHKYRISGNTYDVLDSEPIFQLIASATSSLDVAVARIDRQEVVTALLSEAKSGTRVRILTEKAYFDDPTYKPFYDQLMDVTKNGGNIEIRTDLDGLPRVMHDRFMIIDQARVVTGSYNWETAAAENTFGDVISILNTAVAGAFTNQFNQMFVERNFGVAKRDDSQHSFLVGGGYGLLEVYFGPTNSPRDMIETEIGQSQNVLFAVQQFKDVPLANFLLNWLAASPDNTMFGLFNNIATIGDNEENAVYLAFANYIITPPDGGGQCIVNMLIDNQFAAYDTMNHKLMFVDHALSNNTPAVIFTTSNYSDLGFSFNDETMLIMRGIPMVNKYLRGVFYDYQNTTVPPNDLTEAGDAQELDQLMTMYPIAISTDATLARGFEAYPCALIFGTVSNFRRQITLQNSDGTFSTILIDVGFEVDGNPYFGGHLDATAAPGTTANPFQENEAINPDHRYMLIIPAGDMTVRTIVLDDTGNPSSIFAPKETTIHIGPGCVKKIDLNISQATQTGTTGGGGGGAGGGA